MRKIIIMLITIVMLGSVFAKAEALTLAAELDANEQFERYSSYEIDETTGNWSVHGLLSQQMIGTAGQSDISGLMSDGACIIYPGIRGNRGLSLMEPVLHVVLLRNGALKAEAQNPDPGNEKKPDDDPPDQDPVKTPDKVDLTQVPFVVYVSGIDVYGDINTKSRSDVNVLVAVNPETKEIALVTTPRDAYVDIPGKTSEYKDKLTHAGNYGVSYSVATLEQLYGINIDYYVRINFSGMEKVVNLLGGVDVVSLYNFTARHGPYNIKKGVNHFNGAQAVSFARERITLPGGDVTRGKHHIELIKGIFAKITTTAVLTNYQSLLDAVSDNFQTDISTNQIAALAAMQLSDGAEWHFTSYASYGDGGTRICNSYRGGELWVCFLKKDSVNRATELITRVLNGEHIPDDEYKYEQ